MVAKKRIRPRRVTIVGLALPLALVVGCTDDRPPRAHNQPSTSSTGRNCADGTGRSSVSDGPLSIGPFDSSALNTSRGPQMKVWFATKRRGVTDDAQLTVSAPAGTQRRYTRERTTANGYQAFYPGLIEISEPGRWTISAKAGPDTICVRVDYR